MPLLFGQPYFGNVFASLKQLSPERYMLVPGYPDVEVKTSRSMPEGAIQDMEEILRELDRAIIIPGHRFDIGGVRRMVRILLGVNPDDDDVLDGDSE